MNTAPQIYTFFGAPGSGKGSLASLCVERLGWVQLSTGDLCRKHVAEGTALGSQIDFALKAGKLVPDEVIIDMVDQWLAEQVSSSVPGIILDGYPRTLVQAHSLERVIKESFPGTVFKVVYLVVPDDVVIERVSQRLVCSNKACQTVYSAAVHSPRASRTPMICDKCASPLMQRADDSAVSIRDRLVVYHKHADALIEYFSRAHELIKLDGQQSLAVVFADFKRAIGRE